jgi:hypothetical protein
MRIRPSLERGMKDAIPEPVSPQSWFVAHDYLGN